LTLLKYFSFEIKLKLYKYGDIFWKNI